MVKSRTAPTSRIIESAVCTDSSTSCNRPCPVVVRELCPSVRHIPPRTPGHAATRLTTADAISELPIANATTLQSTCNRPRERQPDRRQNDEYVGAPDREYDSDNARRGSGQDGLQHAQPNDPAFCCSESLADRHRSPTPHCSHEEQAARRWRRRSAGRRRPHPSGSRSHSPLRRRTAPRRSRVPFRVPPRRSAGGRRPGSRH